MSQSKSFLRAAAASAALVAAPYALGQEAIQAAGQAAAESTVQVPSEVDAAKAEVGAAASGAAAAEANVQDSAKATADAAASGDAKIETAQPSVDAKRAVDGAGAALDRSANRTANAAERTANRAEDVAEASSRQVQAMLRGPVHEAFARPQLGEVAHGEIAPVQPPAPLKEIAPPSIDGMEFIEGYWSFDKSANDFVWVTGTLRRAPQGAVWVASEWTQTAEGHVRTPGYWKVADGAQASVRSQADAAASAAAELEVAPRKIETPDGIVDLPGYVDHPLQRRGVLFAPLRLVDRAEDRVENRVEAVTERAQNRVDNRLADANDRVQKSAGRASDVRDRAQNRVANAAERVENRVENAQERVETVRENVTDRAQAEADQAQAKLSDTQADVRDTIDGANAQVDAAAEVAADAQASAAMSSQGLAADAAATSLTMVDGALTIEPTERIATDSLMLHLFVDEANDAFYFGDYYGDAGQALNLVHWSESPATPGSLLSAHEEFYDSQAGSFAERLAAWNKYFVANAMQRPAHTVEEAKARLSDASASKLQAVSHLSQSVLDRSLGAAENLDPQVRANADLSGDVSAQISPNGAKADTLQSLNAEVQARRVQSELQGSAALGGEIAPGVRVPRNGVRTPRVGAPNGSLNGAIDGAGGLGAPGVGNLGGGLGGAVGGALGK